MKTPLPNKEAETLEEIADRIAYKYLDRTVGSSKLKADILSCLRSERERAIQIVNRFSICRDHDQPTHCVQCDLRHKAIVAIREGR